ncbi:MAG: C39 family peptidase [Candidatus Cloacimonetes bacterium]|nr:C39 family peptidase [Candidatus Cloacimonadota bacterium]
MKNLLTISVVFFISVNISANNNDGLKKDDILTELLPQQSTTGKFRPDNVSIGITERSTKNQIIISGVPSYLWRHGCGPTALGMVIGYYDGIGFSALIDGNASTQTNNVNNAIANSEHYNDYSEPIDYYPDLFTDMSETDGAHTSNCIADFMETSWSSEESRYGSSWSNLISVAFTEYVQTCNDDYFTNTTYERFSGASWDTYKNEINNNRPVVLLVDSDGNGYTDHFVTGIGYDESNSTYAIYDTWDNSIHWYQWHRLSNNYGWGIYDFNTFEINGIVNLPDLFSFAEDGQLIENFANYSDDIDLDVFTLTVSGNTEINAEIDGLNVTFTATATENWNGTERNRNINI